VSAPRHRGPATWESRVRGLLLGLALGDALGAVDGDVPRTGPLRAGCATQLAAWTAEGLLRSATRYGGEVVGNPFDVVLYAYQRWALVRGAWPAGSDNWFPVYDGGHLPTRGWLLDVPAMAEVRGSSPTTLTAATTGRAQPSTGYHAMVRTLPLAAFVGPRATGADPEHLAHHARGLAWLTHDSDGAREAAALAVRLAAACLVADDVRFTLISTLAVPQDPWTGRLADAAAAARGESADLARIAPDRSGMAALAGAVYTAASFPGPDAVGEALTFARWAPHPKPLAAATGALLGATYGYEAIPADMVERLELGWVVDRLARDLALQVRENQAGSGWKDDMSVAPLDPWWDTRYPGV
jgi:hypothetical protein